MTSLLRRRCYSSATSACRSVADTLCADLLCNAKQAPPQIRAQALDPDQLHRLSRTLKRPSLYSDLPLEEQVPANQLSGRPVVDYGTPLPPGYHLAYFTPTSHNNELGPDGTDLAFSPPAPFTRRMWAGGRIEWRKDHPLRVGTSLATETSSLVSAVVKRNRVGEEMIIVSVEKEYRNGPGEGEVSLVDRRDWVFRETLPEGAAEASLAQQEEGQEKRLGDEEIEAMLPSKVDSNDGPILRTRDFVQTPTSLFRFSALTFNAHMIHYSRDWARQMEGQRDVVVHGPLNLINMLDLWRDSQQGDRGNGYAIPASINYRATAPFYVGERYRGILQAEGGKTAVRLWGIDGKGGSRVGMMGDIVN
ncbi:MAG: hypothetical protein OHK93_007510 [Ramalina farinacea]|uniref:Mesaconyl-C4 CoA hydratase n=1 Tax=Ramalina farinacea TaxID=258253 RepID=A0AA43TR09_9LECA|nr:hypothetical protein [Ramalina farinacea]